MNRKSLMFLVLFLGASSAIAGQSLADFKKALKQRLPLVNVEKVAKAPVEGWFEVHSGVQVVYMTEDARYMLDGDFVDLVEKRNLTEDAKSGMRLNKLASLGEEEMIIYEPEKTKHTVTIVTDVNCPYCRRLHDEMAQYLENGVRVRYIFMPLKGQEDINKTISIWCSEDRNTSLDIVKAGGDIDTETCDHPINKHLQLSRNLGVKGTPAIILEDGTMLPGYVPIAKLVAELNRRL